MALSPAEEQSFDRLHSWLDASTDLPTPNSQADSLRPLKRARDSSVDEMNDGQSTRSHSPSKRQRREEHSSCGRSASRPASIVPSERTTFTATSSAKRTASPSRYLTELRMAEPSVSLAPITMPPQPLSDDAMIHLGQLRRRLGDALKGKYIPGGLKDAIEQDSDFSLSLSMEPIEEEAFDYSDKRTLDDFALVNILQQVKRIYQSAALCAQFGRDENAWCFGVIWPLIELATTIHGKNQWQTESVQSQSINPQYLSRISSSSSSKDRCLTRKTDFCFSYSYLNPHFCELYKQLEAAKAMPVSHTTDNFTSRTFLFSGIEVKPENGDLKEAQVQMCVWMAASLRKKIELAKSFHTIEYPFTTPLEPAIITIGHDHRVYYAYSSSVHDDIAILGPEEKFMNLSTRSPQGILKLVSLYGAILNYGCQPEMTNTEASCAGPWGQFLGELMEKLVADN